jgi:hypothetical protein
LSSAPNLLYTSCNSASSFWGQKQFNAHNDINTIHGFTQKVPDHSRRG